MKEYIKRMLCEKEELEKRIEKAEAALKNPPYGFGAEDEKLLSAQVVFMRNYLDVLTKRIERESEK